MARKQGFRTGKKGMILPEIFKFMNARRFAMILFSNHGGDAVFLLPVVSDGKTGEKSACAASFLHSFIVLCVA